MGVTVPERKLSTYAVLPLGDGDVRGVGPDRDMAVPGMPVAVSMGVTLFDVVFDAIRGPAVRG